MIPDRENMVAALDQEARFLRDSLAPHRVLAERLSRDIAA